MFGIFDSDGTLLGAGATIAQALQEPCEYSALTAQQGVAQVLAGDWQVARVRLVGDGAMSRVQPGDGQASWVHVSRRDNGYRVSWGRDNPRDPWGLAIEKGERKVRTIQAAFRVACDVAEQRQAHYILVP